MPTSSSTILEPRLVVVSTMTTTQVKADSDQPDNLIECSLHTLPKPLLREFRHVFGEKYLNDIADSSSQTWELLAIPTNQQARANLVAVGDDIEQEKDRLLNVFMDFGKELSHAIRSLGFWADYVDPCSGLPMLTKDCNKVYSEVDGMECLLNYKAYNAGFCKVLTHPKWGSACYPATVFCYGDRKAIQSVLEKYPTRPN